MTTDAPPRLAAPGSARDAGAFITACAVSRDGNLAAFATAEGIVHLACVPTPQDEWRSVQAHDGSVLSLAVDVGACSFLTGGDDNRLCRIDGAEVHELSRGRRWVEHVCSVVDGKGGWIASAQGKQVALRDAAGGLVREYAHDSTVAGLAFDAKGKRLAAAHYGGVSLRFVAVREDKPRLLAWKGSHLEVAIHPAGEAVVSSMQERELHGWRLADGHNMRMSGYPQKTRSLSFSRNGRWLATSGADAVVLWPFFGGGPMGREPNELAGVAGVVCTRVAFHPLHEIVAAGFADGRVLMAEIANGRALQICAPGPAAISALCFAPNGAALAFATEAGGMALVDLGGTRTHA
ncbi:WD40 repeat domain-containing protein [Lichenicoccus sp.]|uniref:WD40 repeat domain-containing protein n=1 Tax=Lichenicoccus sp. TaxID=2781899 RepID=UPI003D11EE79